MRAPRPCCSPAARSGRTIIGRRSTCRRNTATLRRPRRVRPATRLRRRQRLVGGLSGSRPAGAAHDGAQEQLRREDRRGAHRRSAGAARLDAPELPAAGIGRCGRRTRQDLQLRAAYPARRGSTTRTRCRSWRPTSSTCGDKLRRMNEAARANLLASQYARRAVSVTLVATRGQRLLRADLAR